MYQETSLTKRLKNMEERLTKLETHEPHTRDTSTTRQKLNRIANITHQNKEDIITNREQLNHMSVCMLHLNRRSYINQNSIAYLLREDKDRKNDENEVNQNRNR